MNLFYLDKNPRVAAEYHCDKHVCKMIVETAQMLSTAHHLCGNPSNSIYQPAYPNHPMTVWVRTNTANYRYAYELFSALLREYTIRYGKHHKSSSLLHALSYAPTHLNYSTTISPLPLCMPQQYQVQNDPIKSYQQYYKAEKLRFAKYTKRPIPYFLRDADTYKPEEWSISNHEFFISK